MATQEQIEDLISKMGAERARLLGALEALSEEQAEFTPENAEGEAQWTAKEQMAHLAQMETAYRAWVEKALVEDGAEVSGVTGEAPAITIAEANSHPVAEHLHELRRQREKTLSLIHEITPDQYERRAANRLFGSLTVMQWLRSYYRHDRMHIDQIAGRQSEYQPRWAEGTAEPDQRRRQ